MATIRSRLNPTLSVGLLAALIVILVGHLVFWDAMTALIGAAGTLLVVAVTVIAVLALGAHLWRLRR